MRVAVVSMHRFCCCAPICPPVDCPVESGSECNSCSGGAAGRTPDAVMLTTTAVQYCGECISMGSGAGGSVLASDLPALSQSFLLTPGSKPVPAAFHSSTGQTSFGSDCCWTYSETGTTQRRTGYPNECSDNTTNDLDWWFLVSILKFRVGGVEQFTIGIAVLFIGELAGEEIHGETLLYRAKWAEDGTLSIKDPCCFTETGPHSNHLESGDCDFTTFEGLGGCIPSAGPNTDRHVGGFGGTATLDVCPSS